MYIIYLMPQNSKISPQIVFNFFQVLMSIKIEPIIPVTWLNVGRQNNRNSIRGGIAVSSLFAVVFRTAVSPTRPSDQCEVQGLSWLITLSERNDKSSSPSVAEQLKGLRLYL
jgi:hypothetical protein